MSENVVGLNCSPQRRVVVLCDVGADKSLVRECLGYWGFDDYRHLVDKTPQMLGLFFAPDAVELAELLEEAGARVEVAVRPEGFETDEEFAAAMSAVVTVSREGKE